MDAIGKILGRLAGVRSAGGQYLAKCPAHDDRKQSLAVRERDGRILLYCHAGCCIESIMSAISIQRHDLFSDSRRDRMETVSQRKLVASYDYTDEDGNMLYQVCRYDPKDFRQRRRINGEWSWSLSGVRRVPYRLPDVLKAVHDKCPVVVVEGEKDADKLRAIGVCATTNAGGAGKWMPEFARFFAGAHVFLIPDADKVGMDHMLSVAASIILEASTVRLIELPGVAQKGDVSDWLQSGGTAEKLYEIARQQKPLRIADRTEESLILRSRVKAACDSILTACDSIFVDDAALACLVKSKLVEAITDAPA